jgi:hypothetical protein
MVPSFYVFFRDSRKFVAAKEALKQVKQRFGAKPVEELGQGENEPDLILTDSATQALRAMGETDRSLILVIYSNEERDQAKAIAGRFPERVHAVSAVADSAQNETGLAPFLLKLVEDKVVKK